MVVCLQRTTAEDGEKRINRRDIQEVESIGFSDRLDERGKSKGNSQDSSLQI